MHTFSFHESVDVVAPVARLWVSNIHAIKVEKRHHVVLCIAGYIDNLQKIFKKEKEKQTLNSNESQILLVGFKLNLNQV